MAQKSAARRKGTDDEQTRAAWADELRRRAEQLTELADELQHCGLGPSFEATVDKWVLAPGRIAAGDPDNFVIVSPDGHRLVAMTESGHFDQATAERVAEALAAPAD